MDLEAGLGMERYLTAAPGIGGRLKKEPEDFVVEELSSFPEEKEDGRYTAAVVRSRNWETNRLVRRLARSLRMSRNRVFFAGTKDKRAVTTQLLVFDAPLEKVSSLAITDVEVLKAYRTDGRILLGDLVGNRFQVTVRDLPLPGERTEGIIAQVSGELLALGGFPNFFGVQRFGAVRPVTHLVGREMVRGDLRRAVELYVANPIEGEDPEEFEARRALEESGDYREALRNYPKGLSFEKAMLNHLVNHGDDFAGALGQLPKNLLMMFVHSYQSYVFNKILSARMARGLPLNRPLPGDLVLPVDRQGLPDHERRLWVDEGNIEKLERRCAEGKAFVSGVLFGSEVELAGGEMGEIERREVEREGLLPADFVIPQMPKLSSKGTRRELLAPLKAVEREVLGDSAVLRFQLTKGCYATSLLREYMKVGGAAGE